MPDYRFETLQVHAGQEPDPVTGSRAVPIYQTTSYVFDDCEHGRALFELSKPGNIYTRIMNPTTDVFEKRVAALEGGVGALAVASGMAAMTLILMNLCRTGDNIVSANTVYGGTYNLLANTMPNYGISAKFVNPDDVSAFDKAVDKNTKAIFVETLGNPSAGIVDFDAVAAVAQKHKIPLIVDNTFATPYIFRPFEHGANIVFHSATKFMGGHGTSVGGIVVDGGNFDWTSGKFPGFTTPDPGYHGLVYSETGNAAFITKARVTLLRDTGACISPFNSFMLLQGLESLSLRVERHNENAKKVAEYLNGSPYAEWVAYPALEDNIYHTLCQKYLNGNAGSIFTFGIKGGFEEAKKFIDNLELFSLLANVADAKSLAIHPASTTHAQMTKEELEAGGIFENTIRLSIGIEHADDIIADLDRTFKKVL